MFQPLVEAVREPVRLLCRAGLRSAIEHLRSLRAVHASNLTVKIAELMDAVSVALVWDW